MSELSEREKRLLAAIEAAEHGSAALPFPHTRLSAAFERFVEWIGEWVSWLWAVLIAVIVLNVVMRYLFNTGLILFEELQWHIYAVGFMIGLSYAFTRDRHVRVDVLAERLSLGTRAWIELGGIVLFVLPFLIFVLIASFPYVYASWAVGEVSAAPGGLPYRWAIKSLIPVAVFMLIVAALARLTRVTALLFGVPRLLPNQG